MAASNQKAIPAAAEPRVIRLSSTAEVDDERIPLFYIDDTEYTIAAHPSAAVGLEYLDLVRGRGTEVAAGWMLETLLGRDGYVALMNYKALTAAQLSQIIEIAGETLMGALETPKAP